jgi:membrane fusion protein (multidrug efflux system)
MNEPVINNGAAGRVKSGKSKLLRVGIGIAILLLIAAGVFAYWYLFMRGVVFSDDARFDGHLVDLAPEIGGTINDVALREGEHMAKGQKAFSLDSKVALAILAQSEAAVKTAQTTVTVAQAHYERAVNGSLPEEIAAAEANAKRMEIEEALAAREKDLAEKLQKAGAESQDNLDRAESARKAAEQAHESSLQALAIIKRGTRPEDIRSVQAELEAAKARLAETEAAVARARIEVARTTVSAPFDGWVVRRWLDPGAMVQPGQPVVSVFDPTTLRVDANIEEKFLHRIAVGDEVDITVDAFPGLKLKGRVAQILRATNSQFSMIPAEGVSGTFIKVTQRVPLRIALESPDPPGAGLIGPGLSVEVRVRVGSASGHAETARHE